VPVNPFKIGLGTRKYQPDKEPFLECSEGLKPGCGCCRIGPCDICLEWEVYGEDIEHGTALDNGTSWTGSAGGIVFVAAWDEYTCTFSVTLDGEEVYSAVLCGEYGEETVTCRNWDNGVSFTKNAGGYNEQSGTFRWAKKTRLEMMDRKGSKDYGSESACARPFCGDDCECTPEELCVSIGTSSDFFDCTGVIPFTGTLCEGKVTVAEWSGNIACSSGDTMFVTLTLTRDAYTDECKLSGSASGTVDGDDISLDLEAEVISDCVTMSAIFLVTIGYEEYTITVNSLECDTCDPGVCLICCDSVPPFPPSNLVCRITLGEVIHPDAPEPPIDLSCWSDLEFNISFLYDVDEDSTGSCSGNGTTRRADCIGNLLDGEFDESCCAGGQWVGSGSNSCGNISVCFIPCATVICPPDTDEITYVAWDVHIAISGGQCDAEGMCLVCGDTIAWSREGFLVCGDTLFTPGTGSVALIVDISES